MFGNKLYSYFSHDVLEGMRLAVQELDNQQKFEEMCKHISEARSEWFVDSQALSASGIDKLHDIFMQQLMDEYGKIELFGEEFWADDLYERIYGEDHIKATVLEQFAEQNLKLPNAEDWKVIMNAWGEVRKMAVDTLNCTGPNDDYYDPEEIKDALEDVVGLLETYFGWD